MTTRTPRVTEPGATELGGPEHLAYGGGWLDRAGARRTDDGWIAAQLAAPGTRLIPLWRDQCLVSGERPVPVIRPAQHAGAALTAADCTVFLGLDSDGHSVFAADLSAVGEDDALALMGADQVLDIRGIVGGLAPAQAASIAYARGLLHWNRHQQYCGTCGTATAPGGGGHQRLCTNPGCGRLIFPRIEPAVIMVVESEDDSGRILLARHRGSAVGGYSTLAGFVEIGESLEDAVRREVAEEAGLRVGPVRYVSSQAWPFPAGLMLGFRAIAAAGPITVDGEELLEARWFTRTELAEHVAAGGHLGRVDSIDRVLLRAWLAEGD